MINVGRRLMKKRSQLIEYQNNFCKQTALDSEIMKFGLVHSDIPVVALA